MKTFRPRVLVAIGLTLLLACEVSAGQPTTITLERAQLTPIVEVDVPAPEEGRIIDVTVAQGDGVDAGGILIKMDDAEQKIAFDKAQIEYNIAKDLSESDTSVRLASKTLAVAVAELERNEDSNRRFPGSVPKSKIDELQLRKDEAELQLEQSRLEHTQAKKAVALKLNALNLAKLKLDRRHIKSLEAAEVLEILPQRGEWVEAGQTVVRLLNRDRLRVEGFMALSQVRPGLKGSAVRISLTVANGGMRPFDGRIVYISPEVDPNNAQVRFVVEVDNSEGLLLPGQIATVIIETKPATQP